MSTRRDYTAEAVEASRCVMIELTRLLGEYREGIVVVGGWVPELLLHPRCGQHIGSTDVDLALDHRTIPEARYRTIHELITKAGYEKDERQPFIYSKQVQLDHAEVTVQVDLLAGEYEGTGKKHRTQQLQDIRPRKARGCDLAFDHPVEVRLEGRLPDGALDCVMVRVADLGPFLAMKAMAMRDRLKHKDAYDIWFTLSNEPMRQVVDSFRTMQRHGLALEALGILSDKFTSVDHTGPRQVVGFLEEEDTEARAVIQRDAFERVQELLLKLR